MGKQRTYWLDLFTLNTWDEFLKAGGTVSGFRESRWAQVQKIFPGDHFLCYLIGIKRFVGILEVTSKPFKGKSRIWDEDIFPCRMKVRNVVKLEPETAVPIFELKEDLSFFEKPGVWGVYFRTSPFRIKPRDAEIIVRALQQAEKYPTSRPFKTGKTAVDHTRIATEKGPVTIPEPEEVEEHESQIAKESTFHTELQWYLLKLGTEMGHNVWVAKNDRGREWKGNRFADLPGLQEKLPVQFDEATNRTIEHIDVLWLNKNQFVAAFEIETTTSIYSGLLRMSDLLSMQPNLDIPLYIVAPDERRDKVMAETNRPTFSRLSRPLSQVCRYIAYSSLKEFMEKHLSVLRHMKPDVIASDEVSESCEIEEV
jgi:hypothetical protein